MEIKVGDYVRLDRCQGINRIEEYDEDIKKYKLEDVIGDEWGDETFVLDENDIIKSSPNIIDLIEVGDYVNGRKVYQVGYNFQDDLVLKMSINKDGTINNYEDFIYEKDIKSIVTKEQFSQMEYKISG